jgi:hypothetical protein
MQILHTCIVMMQIPLTKGQCAIVDDEDFEYLQHYSWSFTVAGAQTRIRGSRKHWLMHRMIMLPPDDLVIDHINHNKLDNRRSNLRIATQRENSQNCRPVKGHEFKGVGVVRGKKATKYTARIGHKGQQIYLGTFVTAVLAARAYDSKALELFGEFACLNFPTK